MPLLGQTQESLQYKEDTLPTQTLTLAVHFQAFQEGRQRWLHEIAAVLDQPLASTLGRLIKHERVHF
jgi:hypothetical protein